MTKYTIFSIRFSSDFPKSKMIESSETKYDFTFKTDLADKLNLA